jgi:hypothetical protein
VQQCLHVLDRGGKREGRNGGTFTLSKPNRKKPKGAFKAYTPFLPKELERIERWRFAKRIRSRADAVRALVMKGLASEGVRRRP